MTRACHIAVRSATGDVFSDAEIDDFLDRLAAKATRARKAEPTLDARQAIAQAAGELTREQLQQALIAKRAAVHAQLAAGFRRARLDAMPAGMDGAKRLEALNVGSERQGVGTSASVDAEGRARQMRLWGQVDIGLSKVPGLKDRLSNFWGRGETGFSRLVAREMARLQGDARIEPTGDEGALHAARVFVKALEDARQMQNDQGAWIGKLTGYVARQAHDADRIAGGMWRELGELGAKVKANGIEGFDWRAARSAAEARAFAAWRDFIRPKLDPKTFDGVELGDPKIANALHAKGIIADPTDPAELMLHGVWQDIVTGRHEQMTGADDLGDFRPKGGLARAVSKERVLHFNSPDDWMDYAKRYGRGNLFATVMGQLERAGRNAALMRTWGPAPEAAFENEVTRLANAAHEAGDAHAEKALAGNMVRARFEAVNGMAGAPVNLRLAQVMRGVRGWEALTKLGSIMLSKATDLPITASVFKRAGGTWLDGYKAGFSGIARLGGEDAKAAADALDVGARSFAGHMGGQYLADDGAPGWTSWATRLMYRINGFEALNNGVRRGAASAYSALLGREAAKDWAGINIGTRETFERFGITPADWEKARQGLTEGDDGRKWFTLEHLADNPDLALKFTTMIHNLLDDTVSEPRARERSGMTMGSRPGTILGELDRSFFQFKGFVNTIVGRHLVPAAGHGAIFTRPFDKSAGYAGVAPAALMAHFIIGTALAGYVSMNAKAMARGELPKGPLGGDGVNPLAVWGASLAQGGGLGLYGDFLFGELNRNGADFDWGSLGGPILSDSETLAKIARQAISGGAVSSVTGRSQIPGELVKLGSSNIPLINLWYTRAALDYLVLWRLQEAVSPGYLQRYEERVKNQEHSDFWLHPTSAAQ